MSDLDVSWVTDFTCCLYGLGELTSCNLDGFDTSNGEIFDSFLGNCFGNNGYTPDVSKLNTSKGRSFKYCFDDWGGPTLDISGWDFSNCEPGGLEWAFSSFDDVTKIIMPEKFINYTPDFLEDPFGFTEASGTLYYPIKSSSQYVNSYFLEYAQEAGYNCVAQGNSPYNWSVQSGSWTSVSNNSSIEGFAWQSVSPGDNGSTVIRCTFSGVSSITFNCTNNGESGYDYLTIGSLDSSCTRTSYAYTMKNTTQSNYTFTCSTSQHYIEFCYSKDGSVSSDLDNAIIYIQNVS